MAKRKGLSICDIMLLICGTIGAILGCAAVLVMYYREAEPMAALNWPLRKFYIKKITDKSMRPTVTWKSLKQDTCTKYESAQMKYGNPQGQMLAKLMEHTLSLPLCGIKPNCRENMSERCIFYDYATDDAIIVLLTNASSLMFLGLAGFCLSISNKPHWKMYAGVCCFLGGILQMGGLVWWVMDTDKYMKRMITQTVYPYGELKGPGAWANAGGAVLMLLGGVCGFISGMMPTGKKPDNDLSGMDPLMAGPFGGQPMGM